MENDMRSIGEMARDSSLGISALRFYDRAGVLVPAWVDPVSGYRWYDPAQLDEARVLARLRRAGMPLADIRLVLAGWASPEDGLVRRLLDAHLGRLEAGLTTARAEFSAVRALLDDRETTMTTVRTASVHLSLPAPALAAALDAVRFAAATDPELPMLNGILFDIEDDRLTVVATDRYRLALAEATARTTQGDTDSRVQLTVPTSLAHAMRALSDGDGTVRLSADGPRVTLEAGDRQTTGRRLDHDFPDYRRLLPQSLGRRAVVDVAEFRTTLETGRPVHVACGGTDTEGPHLSVLSLQDDGTVALCADGDNAPTPVAVNRAFLLDALRAAALDHLVIEVVTPTTPVVLRHPDTDRILSLLMPVRLED
ncbi:MerR family transcriptional regulator [Streptomyces sp. NPDC060194]|uniref:DNA polymerase III subunit beta family protein n=1 Tax=Streptomyces sp. NPDC060194 TaxID=3347069 RepID=UPI0036664F4C